MNLKEYLKQNDYTIARAARNLKITPKHLGYIVLGKSNASRYLAKAIEDFTAGHIKAETLMRPRKQNG